MSATLPTIYAPATPLMRGAVGIVRVSGPHAYESLKLLTDQEAAPTARLAKMLHVKHPKTGKRIDHALILPFKGPASFTGEDVVEYHLHGGQMVMSSLLDALGACEHHQMAAPGEFTRRAFENGKMDLTSAEAVNDLIHAETEAQQDQALEQLGGTLSKLYEEWRKTLIETAAYLEATIDFADEDLPEEDIAAKVMPGIERCIADIKSHLNDNRRGERIRDGIKIAVIGAPNAGKSSLVNQLAQRDVCITSDMAGTTRDIIEVYLNIAGYPVIVSDTAGLRPSQLGDSAHDAIEGEGIKRALKRAQEADLRLLVLDASELPSIHKQTKALYRNGDIMVLNKADLAESASKATPKTAIDGIPVTSVSAKRGEGIDDLTRAIERAIKNFLGQASGPSPTQERHRNALERSVSALGQALPQQDKAQDHMKPFELIAEDLRVAAGALGAITGRIDVEDMLDVIFRDFCIGK